LRYLRSNRSRLLLACFMVSSVLLFAFPAIDLEVSRAFFNKGFPWASLWWQPLLRAASVWFLWLSMLAVLGIYALNRWTRKSHYQIDGKTVVYLFLVLILGAGMIVNLGLKDHFGRARPREVTEFGGTKIFTPAFVMSQQCQANCSFSSGEGAAGFFAPALALALSRRRRILAAAIGIGVVVSFARVAAGAHFLSDVVVSFFVMLIVADVLRCYMRLPGRDRLLPEVREPADAEPGVTSLARTPSGVQG
jgi:lipid A 4'-phosphatase